MLHEELVFAGVDLSKERLLAWVYASHEWLVPWSLRVYKSRTWFQHDSAMQLIYFWWESQPQSTAQLPLPLQPRMQELHLSATSLLHFEYSDVEAQSFSVMFVWALARPESAATVATDARRNLDSIVDPVLVG